MKTMQTIPVKNRLILNVVPGKEYQLKIVDVKNEKSIKEDFFYGVYCQAYREAQKIIIESDNTEKELQETTNNIIAFCGERGQGKSSAMLSFSKLLKSSNEKAVIKSFENFYDNYSDYEFKVLDRMDPTEFENCHSILSVIISRIFNEFQKELKQNQIDISKKNELLELFQQCYKDIDVIKDANSFDKLNYGYEDDLEELSMLSDSANIKTTFSDMVNKFLDFVCAKKNHFLVIQIDDTDLNVSKAYEIVEDVRKYFMIPNVIILMAVNPKLLINAIEQSFQSNFKLLMDKGVVNIEHTHSMALKYTNKLIPGSRRINLPTISKNSSPLDESIELRYSDKSDAPSENKTYNISGDIQDIVLRLIYEKTGIILIKRNEDLHPIISKNTRALANFLSILNDLSDLNSGNLSEDFNDMFALHDPSSSNDNISRIKLRISNLEKLEQYFINTWIEENVGVYFTQILEEWRNANYSDKNKVMMYFLENEVLPKLNQIDNKKSKRSNYTSEQINEKNSNEQGTTVSDILGTIKKLENNYNNEKYKNLIFAIQMIYTIAIHKRFCYQIILESEKKVYWNYSISFFSFVGPMLRDSFQKAIGVDKNKTSRVFFNSKLPKNFISEEIIKSNNKYTKILFEICGEIEDYLLFEEIDDYLNYSFDISSPLVKLLQFNQHSFANKTIKNATFDENLYWTRITSFQIIANIELVREFEKTVPLFHRMSLKTTNNSYITVYKHLETFLNNLEYLPIKHINLDWITNALKENAKLIYKIYEQKEKSFGDYSSLIRYYSQLEPFAKTYTIETLKERLDNTAKLFSSIKKLVPAIDLKFENKELEEMLKILETRQTLSKNTCLQHQVRINKTIRSVKAKLSDHIYL